MEYPKPPNLQNRPSPTLWKKTGGSGGGPFNVDAIVDFHAGTANGTLVSSANLLANTANSTVPVGTQITNPVPLLGTAMTFNGIGKPLKSVFKVNGVVVPGSATQSIKNDLTFDNESCRYVFNVGNASAVSFGFWFQTTMGPPAQSFHNYDMIQVRTNSGKDVEISYIDNAGLSYVVRGETTISGVSTATPGLTITKNTWYWITVRVRAGILGVGGLDFSIYDSSGLFLFSATALNDPVLTINSVDFGVLNTGTNAGFFYNFGNFAIDYTNAVYPLGP